MLLGATVTTVALALLLAAPPALANPTPIITDFAGNGTGAAPVPGPAASSPLQGPFGVAADTRGNVYIADTVNVLVEKVAPDGTLSILAGNGNVGAPTPGPATSSALAFPNGVAVDQAGNVYIADTNNNMVEKVSPAGTLAVVAGTGTSGAPTPGPATSSKLNGPKAVTVGAAGDVYIVDSNNNMVEKVTPGGTLSIFAGTGTAGSPTPGPATSSDLSGPAAGAVDTNGNLYIADRFNSVVERVTPAGTLSIYAGTGTAGPPTPGPATSSDLKNPRGVTVDAQGNAYISDNNNHQVEKVTSGGTLSIVAGTGALGAPAFGGPATNSPLEPIDAIAVNANGTLYIADSVGNMIDRVGLATPGAPGNPGLTAGDGSAQLSFTAPLDQGTSAITGYQVSLDGGSTWQSLATSPGLGGTLTATLNGLTNDTLYTVIVRAVNNAGPGAYSPTGTVMPGGPPPTNVGLPAVSGTAFVDHTLSCSPGSWSGGAVRYSYQWKRDGTPIPGATGQTYAVTPADPTHTLTCTVTAYTAIGGSAQSTSIGVVIPGLSLCPKPAGRLSGATLGPVRLGLTRARARRLLPGFSRHGRNSDAFCLAGGQGILVGYSAARVRGKHSGTKPGRIIVALTANPYYIVRGVKPGTRVSIAGRRLGLAKPIHIGRNSWYLIPHAKANWVLKTRDGVIQEIGIVDRQLTSTRADQARLLKFF
jgi:sugar lactone lactonase YvrE